MTVYLHWRRGGRGGIDTLLNGRWRLHKYGGRWWVLDERTRTTELPSHATHAAAKQHAEALAAALAPRYEDGDA